jgi:hypothetical protein
VRLPVKGVSESRILTCRALVCLEIESCIQVCYNSGIPYQVLSFTDSEQFYIKGFSRATSTVVLDLMTLLRVASQ